MPSYLDPVYPASDSQHIIKPPPPRTYPSFQALHDDAVRFAKEHGYDYSLKNAEKSLNPGSKLRYYRYDLMCTRAGKPAPVPKTAGKRRPKATSKKCGCKSGVIIAAKDPQNPDGPWELRHKLKSMSWRHNHKPAQDAAVFPRHRRAQLTDHIKKVIEEHFESGVRPAQSLALIRKQVERHGKKCLIQIKDIRNYRAKLYDDKFALKTKVEALFESIHDFKYWFRYQLDEQTNQLRQLIWINNPALSLLQKCPDVLIIDCTFKTNKYNLPLLNIVFVTGNNTTIHLGYALLPTQEEQSYAWAFQKLKEALEQHGCLNELSLILIDREQACINALDKSFNLEEAEFEDLDNIVLDTLNRQFPRVNILLCQWHMNKDVMAYARAKCKDLGTTKVRIDGKQEVVDTERTTRFEEDYKKILKSPTEEDFEAARKEIRQLSPQMATYLDKNWWPYKEKIVACWTNKYTTFGLLSTSRVEGAHASMKRWLQSSRSDIYSLFRTLNLFFEEHVRNVIYKEEAATVNLPRFAREDFYVDINKHITRYALSKMYEVHGQAKALVEERKKDPSNFKVPPCKQSFSKGLGYPCKHEWLRLLDAQVDGRSLSFQPHQFHKHWWIDRTAAVDPVVAPRIREPAVRENKRKRPSHKVGFGQFGTRRDLSKFEYLEKEAALGTVDLPTTTPVSPERVHKPNQSQKQASVNANVANVANVVNLREIAPRPHIVPPTTNLSLNLNSNATEPRPVTLLQQVYAGQTDPVLQSQCGRSPAGPAPILQPAATHVVSHSVPLLSQAQELYSDVHSNLYNAPSSQWQSGQIERESHMYQPAQVQNPIQNWTLESGPMYQVPEHQVREFLHPINSTFNTLINLISRCWGALRFLTIILCPLYRHQTSNTHHN